MYFKIPAATTMAYIQAELKFKTTQDPNEIRINSIYENDSKFKCYINIDTFQFCDFKGGVSGSCYSLFKDLLGVESNKEVLRYLMKNYGDGQFLKIENKLEEIKTNENIIEEFNEHDKPIWFKDKDKIGAFGKQCLKYLLSRKIPIEYIRKMGYVYNPVSKFHKRIILPYFEDGKEVYFQARSVDSKNSLRYLNPAGLNKQNYVFNYDAICDDVLIICEGIMDAMSIDPNEQVATCMSGAFLTPKQLEKIFTKAKPSAIIYVPDQDETGFKELEKNLKNIYTYADYSPEVLIFNPPEGCKDLNDMLIKTGKNIILKKDTLTFDEYKRQKFLQKKW